MPNAVYDQILDKVVADIRALNLDKVGQNVHKRKWSWDDAPFYGITVSWGNERYGASGFNANGTNEQDLIGYPCEIWCSQGTHRGTAADIDRITQWRQSIRRAFNNKRIAGVTSTGAIEVCCKVVMDDVAVPEAYQKKNLDVSKMTVWAWYLEPRT